MAASGYPAMLPLQLKKAGSSWVVQSSSGSTPGLTCDPAKGTVAPLQSASQGADSTPVYGVIGVAQLTAGCALIVISAADQVGALRGFPVYRVTKVRVLGPPSPNTDDAKYVELLESVFDASGSIGRYLLFSYHTDLTLSQQRASSLATDSSPADAGAFKNADARFFFNRQLSAPLSEAGLEQFVLPLVLASFTQIGPLEFRAPSGKVALARVTLIARRSLQRPGVRHWRRGADGLGAVANFVETEQLVEFDNASGGQTSAFLQIRGSIPLLWSQIPNIKYKPTTVLAPSLVYRPAFDRHAKQLLETYQNVTAINLANQHGSEGVLSAAFKDETRRFSGIASGFRLVAFDFHKECGASRYHRLSVLWDQLAADFSSFGWYLEGGEGERERQRGVLRTNCIDCLDRTNVVQGVLGRKHIEALLTRLGLLQAGQSLAVAYPKVEQAFKVMWADHGDDISRQYAGTGALKSGFTRTGKRGIGGLLDDGVKSIVRYYLNNFQDGRKQDALDLASGAFRVAPGKPSPFKRQPSPTLPLLLAFLSFWWAIYNFGLLATGSSSTPGLSSWLLLVLLPLILFGFIMLGVVKYGKKLVCRPQLCPELSQPW